MDQTQLLSRITSTANLERAFRFALHDRRYSDQYHDYFELDHVVHNRREILARVAARLSEVGSYSPQPAYAYFMPKNSLCFRRMIYIPFSDLISRYAVIGVISDILDGNLRRTCFANRRATGADADKTFTESYKRISWPRFCQWQRENASRYTILLRTDISAFYDSLSHDYLITVVAQGLGVETGSDLMSLFRRLLQVPVVSYSHLNNTPQDKQVLRQGLAIGNSTEGFLANIFLSHLDDIMSKIEGIQYGRYNDDIRIFAASRQEALRAVMVLQERLLEKGLNLNASKTRIAESPAEIERMLAAGLNGYFDDCELENEELLGHIDKEFDDFDQCFAADCSIHDDTEAKNFCKFLGHRRDGRHDLLTLEQRSPQYIERLGEILIHWQGSCRYASFLLVESAFEEGVDRETRDRAFELIMETLRNPLTSFYTKYRIIHHLTRLQMGGKADGRRYLHSCTEDEQKDFGQVFIECLGTPAFELNIASLYALRLLEFEDAKLLRLIQEHVPKPLGEPIKNVIFYLTEPSRDSSVEALTDNPITMSPTDVPTQTIELA
jgi:hypothetical protein